MIAYNSILFLLSAFISFVSYKRLFPTTDDKILPKERTEVLDRTNFIGIDQSIYSGIDTKIFVKSVAGKFGPQYHYAAEPIEEYSKRDKLENDKEEQEIVEIGRFLEGVYTNIPDVKEEPNALYSEVFIKTLFMSEEEFSGMLEIRARHASARGGEDLQNNSTTNQNYGKFWVLMKSTSYRSCRHPDIISEQYYVARVTAKRQNENILEFTDIYQIGKNNSLSFVENKNWLNGTKIEIENNEGFFKAHYLPGGRIPDLIEGQFRSTSIFGDGFWNDFVESAEIIAYNVIISKNIISNNNKPILYLGKDHISYNKEGNLSYYTTDIVEKRLYNNTVNPKILRVVIDNILRREFSDSDKQKFVNRLSSVHTRRSDFKDSYEQRLHRIRLIETILITNPTIESVEVYLESNMLLSTNYKPENLIGKLRVIRNQNIELEPISYK